MDSGWLSGTPNAGESASKFPCANEHMAWQTTENCAVAPLSSVLTRTRMNSRPFNPYLETNLSGCVPNAQASPCAPSPPQTPWTGVHTNCMTCHRMAAWGGTGINPPYWPNGFISPDNASLFGGY